MKKQVTHGRNQIGSSRARHTAPAQDIIREGSFHPASFAVFALLSLLVMFGWYVFVCDTLLQNLGRLHPTKGIPPWTLATAIIELLHVITIVSDHVLIVTHAYDWHGHACASHDTLCSCDILVAWSWLSPQSVLPLSMGCGSSSSPFRAQARSKNASKTISFKEMHHSTQHLVIFGFPFEGSAKWKGLKVDYRWRLRFWCSGFALQSFW